MSHTADNPANEANKGLEVTGKPRYSSQRGVGRAVTIWVMAAGAATLILGSWAFVFPEHFFTEFPVTGAHWVSTLGEFNNHLTRDFGAAEAGLGSIAILVAARGSRDSVIATMAGFVVFGVLHLGYHFTTFHHFNTSSAVAQTVALATFVVVPLGVLLALRQRDKRAS